MNKVNPQTDTRVVTKSQKTGKSSTRSLDGKFSGKGSKKWISTNSKKQG